MADNEIVEGVVKVTWGEAVADAEEVVAQLKAQKQTYQADRRELAAQIAEIRADYRATVAHRIPMTRRSGFLGLMIRGKRAVERGNANDHVRPLERQKQTLTEALVDIDRAVARLQAWIAANGGPTRKSRATPPRASDPLATIGKLAELRDRGAITEEEYQAKKGELLAKL